MSRARDIANAITVPEFSGNVEIIGTSPELTFETTNSSHYNFQISVQENVSGGLEISSGSADADSSNDTFTPRLVVLNGGNVGIGNSSPSYLLSLSSASTTQAEIKTTATNGTAQIRFTNDARTYTIGIDNNDSFFIYDATGTSSRFVVNSSGNVGIGTTSPEGITSGVVTLSILDSGGKTTGDKNGSISFKTNDASFTGTYSDGVTAEIFSMAETSTGAAYGLGFLTGTISSSDRNERMRITSLGNVGIGTTTPAYKLHQHVSTSSENYHLFTNSTTGSSSSDGFRIGIDSNENALVWHREANSIQFATNNTERMRIASDGSVGIGCTPKTFQSGFDNLQIGGNIAINVDSTGVGAGIYFSNNVYRDATNSRWEYIYTDEASQYLQAHGGHRWRYAASGSADAAITWSEVMRTDTDGNLLVGTTDTSVHNNTTGTGTKIGGDGRFDVARSADTCATFNRTGSSDGTIVQFRKDGSAVGNIAVGGSSAQPVIGSANTSAGGTAAGLRFDCANNSIQPWNVVSNALVDDTIDLGLGNIRFDDIFATNSTINTSDENEKQDIASMTTAELAVGKRLSTLFKTFRWKSKVTEKADKARTHSGIIAQQVKAAFEAEGLDATKYALFCSDTWTNDDGKEQTRMGVRYPELLSFIASYNESRFTAIEARLTALEGG